jgi:flagellar FliL protein
MSESPEKPQEEIKAENNTNAAAKLDSNDSKKSSKMILFGFIGLTCVLMLTLGVLATLLLTGGNQATQVAQTDKKNTSAKKEAKKEEHKEEKKEEHKEEGGDGSKEGEQAESSAPEFYQVRPSIVITLPASGRTRYVSLDIDLMTHTKSSVKTLEAYAPLIKSNLIDLLSKQTFDEMITEEGKKNLRKQALTLLQTLMNEQAGDPIIEQVLFTSFIVQ